MLGLHITGLGIVERMVLSLLTAFLICVVLSPGMIRRLQRLQIGQMIREEGIQAHLAKSGTPTMGGIIIIVAILVATTMWSSASLSVVIALIALLWLGAVGFLDDFLKVIRKNPGGLPARWKFIAQLGLGIALGVYLRASGAMPDTLYVPLIAKSVPLGAGYLILVALVICGSSNAVNLTDGLDGLAAGVVMVVALCYAGIAYVAGNAIYARHLGVPHVLGAGELAILCAAMTGACIGFLWYNSHPATVFMGDTGSLALGGVLGTIAVLVKEELLLVIIGGIFVVEALSVMIQVAVFRLTGRRKRVFLMSPIHHHFEKGGWPESKVVIRFWIVALMFALAGISILGIGSLTH